jgi:phage/plasmid primase-like uncharacterized protein
MMNHLELIDALHAAGLNVKHVESGKLTRCKTIDDRHGQQSGWYRLYDDLNTTVCIFGSWKNSSRGVWVEGNRNQSPRQRADISLLIERAKREREREQAEQWALNHAKLTKLWAETTPIKHDDAVSKYLLNRRLSVPDTNVIRSHAGLDYWHDGQCIGTFPAMVSAITSPSDTLVSLHRTYLTIDGHKAPAPTVKKLCASAGPLMGASIKISAPMVRDDGNQALGIGEGIETALAAAMLFGVPVLSAVSAHGLAAFEPPHDVQNIYIFADNDLNQVGQGAAARLAEKLTYQGHTVRVHTPSIIGDWNDELASMEVQP